MHRHTLLTITVILAAHHARKQSMLALGSKMKRGKDLEPMHPAVWAATEAILSKEQPTERDQRIFRSEQVPVYHRGIQMVAGEAASAHHQAVGGQATVATGDALGHDSGALGA